MEVILNHLTDLQEKELVKAELSRRYYNYYLSLAPEAGPEKTAKGSPCRETPENQGNGAPLEGQEEELIPEVASDTMGEDTMPLAGLEEIQPIALTSSATPPAEGKKPSEQKPGVQKDKQKRCFIATSAYGSASAPQVLVLKQFRDQYLRAKPWGEWGLSLYYLLSPNLAAVMDQLPALRLLARVLLTPIIGVLTIFFGQRSRKQVDGKKIPSRPAFFLTRLWGYDTREKDTGS